MNSEDIATKREIVSNLGRTMVEKGLTTGTGGNISARVGGGAIAITPSGVPYENIRPEDVPIVSLDGEQLRGELSPSSETQMHTIIHRERDDVGGVVHTHSPYATAFASIGDSIPGSHYLIASIGTEIPLAGYERYGSVDLADEVVDTLGTEYDACLLENHGVVAVGDTAKAAFETAMIVEYCARIHYQALSIGEPKILSEQEINGLEEQFRSYGQNTD